MNPNAKTPVMVLQELSVKKGFSTPEYSIIHARQGTHENEFHYQVNTAGISAIGMGRSKQIAKHNAASKALEILAGKGLYAQGEVLVQAPWSEPVTTSPEKQLLTVNSIGSLGEICMDNKLPVPQFVPISDVGPPHCKEFTYECHMAGIVTRATAGTKKLAKQLAAKEMLERVMQVLPELVAECSEDPINVAAITDQDEQAIDQYIQLRDFKRPKPNLAVKIHDYDQNFQNIMKELNVDVNELRPFLNNENKSEETLAELLKKLELEFIFEMLQDDPIMLTLTVNTDVPFTVIGESHCIENAKRNAVLRTFEFLNILIS